MIYPFTGVYQAYVRCGLRGRSVRWNRTYNKVLGQTRGSIAEAALQPPWPENPVYLMRTTNGKHTHTFPYILAVRTMHCAHSLAILELRAPYFIVRAYMRCRSCQWYAMSILSLRK